MRSIPPSLPILLAVALATSGCNTLQRLSEVGDGPKLSPVTNPTQDPRWQPISMPMPAPVQASAGANSLWRSGSRAFFRDQRAAQVGDILTVLVEINERAELSNQSNRNREGADSLGIPSLFGLESSLSKILPNSVNPSSLVSASGSQNATGTGAIKRNEAVTLKVAAVVTQVLPNGNLVLQGRQEVKVNQELRELLVTGVIRSQDIASDNTVKHDRMAEARIAYGGRGTISDVQAPRWGQQVLDLVLPF